MSQLTRFPRNLFSDLMADPSSLGYLIRPLHGEGLPSEFKCDIRENPQAYLVHAELPGVSKEDLQITVDNGVLTIAAEVKQHDQKTEDEKLVRSERFFGSVSRSFQLPLEVDQAAAKASYENGILELNLPKKQAQGGRRIEVS
jgi:HSP20 family protein